MIEVVAKPWLRLHCQGTPGVNRGALFLVEDGGAMRCAAEWPERADAPDALAEIALAAASERQAAVRASSSEDGKPGLRSEIGVPFRAGESHGVVAVEVVHGAAWDCEPSCKSVIDSLIGGASWLEALARDASGGDRDRAVLELLERVLRAGDARDAGAVLATELAARLRCERASLGWLRGREIRVEALSHSADFDTESELARALGRAMEEAIDQDAVVALPAVGPAAQVTLEHERLREGHGSRAVCTIPLAADGRVVGALCVESRRDGWSEGDVAFCTRLADFLGPALELKTRADDGAGRRLARDLRDLAKRLGKRGQEITTGAVVGAVLLALVLLFGTGTYRVTADATLEGRVQRAVVASFDGFVAEALVRAGDIVAKGEPMARLEDRDLVLERRRWAGRHAQLSRELREAFASHDRSQVRILQAQLDQAKAQLALAEEQLARSTLLAPFDGVVVRGDLSQSLGSPVERGEVMFEVAPLDGYRIILEVPEREISEVGSGQRGELALTAIPDETFPLTVERVIPVSVPEDGRNVFRVEASLDRPIETLRPGMEGVGKIEIEERRLAWIWTHEMVRWIRLRLWSWLP